MVICVVVCPWDALGGCSLLEMGETWTLLSGGAWFLPLPVPARPPLRARGCYHGLLSMGPCVCSVECFTNLLLACVCVCWCVSRVAVRLACVGRNG